MLNENWVILKTVSSDIFKLQYIDLVYSLRDLAVVLKVIPWLSTIIFLWKCCQTGVRNEAEKSHKSGYTHCVFSNER